MRPYWKNIDITLDAIAMGRIKGLTESADVSEARLTRKIVNFSGLLLWVIIYGVVGFEETLRHWISQKPKELFYANFISD